MRRNTIPPTPRRCAGLRAWLTVRDEVSGVLSAGFSEQMSDAAALFTDCGRRWFCLGQGRSGLVAQMAAMRLMHDASRRSSANVRC